MKASFLTKVVSVISQLTGEKHRYVAVDPRTEQEKSNDYVYGNDVVLAMGSPNQRITKLPFIPYNQNSMSACGAFAASHARRLFENTVTYPPQWYRERTNYPAEGMFLKDVLKTASKASEQPTPTDAPKYLTEIYGNALPFVNIFGNDRDSKYEYVTIKPYDTDAVIAASNNGYPVVIAFFSTIAEWQEEMTPWDTTTVYIAPVHHYVTVLPNSHHFLNDNEWVSVVDSSPSHGFSLRHLSIQFLKKRMWLGAGFYYPVKLDAQEKKVVPTINCSFGQRNTYVKTLQAFMMSEGLMNSIHMTGYYGSVTAAAVLKWQLDNVKSATIQQLNDNQGKYWGPLSIEAAKNKYPNQ